MFIAVATVTGAKWLPSGAGAAGPDVMAFPGHGGRRGPLARWRSLETRRLPYVMVDSEPIAGVACVNTDDVGGAYESMRAVLGAGHRRIGASA